MKGIRWLGWGPYRVWQNRMDGMRLGVWQNACNDTTPGESRVHPEFKGYSRGWRWARFEMTEGSLTATNGGAGSFLGVYTPDDGRDGPVLNLPATGPGLFRRHSADRHQSHAGRPARTGIAIAPGPRRAPRRGPPAVRSARRRHWEGREAGW